MSTEWKRVLGACWVALLAACGAGTQDDIVIRTDTQQAGVSEKVTGADAATSGAAAGSNEPVDQASGPKAKQ